MQRSEILFLSLLIYLCRFLSATELKFRADYSSTPCGVGVVVVVVRVQIKKWITF